MDLKLIDNGNGGELVKTTNDLAVIDGFQNMIYLALFGGNVEASTPVTRIATEEAFDWWANSLLDPNDASVQMNSETERMLNNVSLTSAGRIRIKQAVEADLAFMRDFANVTVEVKLVGVDKVAIGVQIVKPDNLQKQDFIYIWDATMAELMDDDSYDVVVTGDSFDFSFDVTFS